MLLVCNNFLPQSHGAFSDNFPLHSHERFLLQSICIHFFIASVIIFPFIKKITAALWTSKFSFKSTYNLNEECKIMKREQKNDYERNNLSLLFSLLFSRLIFSFLYCYARIYQREKKSNKRITSKMRLVKLKKGDSEVRGSTVRGLFRWVCFSSMPLIFNGGCQVIHSPPSSTAPLHQGLSVPTLCWKIYRKGC